METIFVLLDIYTEEEIEKMMDGIEPGIDFKEYNYGEWESPPFHVLKDRMGINTTRSRRKKIKQFAYYAAMWLSLAVFIVISILFFLGPQLRYSCGGSAGEAEIPTGVYSCRLTLTNGCSILIDSSFHGLILSEDNIEIVRLETGELLYRKIGSGSKKDEVDKEYNIITTAPGAQYKVILSNGSKIRLNAASSIRFPMDFTEQNHVIELKGEAFIEIPLKPHLPVDCKGR
jgi:transmembrane sensor